MLITMTIPNYSWETAFSHLEQHLSILGVSIIVLTCALIYGWDGRAMTWMRESPSSAWLFEWNRIPRFSTCKVPANQCGGSPDSRIPITHLLMLCHRRIWVEFLALLIYARPSNVIERPVLIMPYRSLHGVRRYLQLVYTFFFKG